MGPFASGKWPHGHNFTRPNNFFGRFAPNNQ
jgi:hypothetical protein